MVAKETERGHKQTGESKTCLLTCYIIKKYSFSLGILLG